MHSLLWVLVLTNTVEVPSRHLRELEESRRQLGRALDRVGDTLSSTHDLVALLDVVLETCALTLRADAAVFYATSAPGIPIEARASYGADVTGVRLPTGGLPGLAGQAEPSPSSANGMLTSSHLFRSWSAIASNAGSCQSTSNARNRRREKIQFVTFPPEGP